MTLRRACIAAVPVICAFASSALAQATLTEGQILNSLAGAGEAAAAVGVDIAAVQREIEQGISKEGGTNAVAPPATETPSRNRKILRGFTTMVAQSPDRPQRLTRFAGPTNSPQRT